MRASLLRFALVLILGASCAAAAAQDRSARQRARQSPLEQVIAMLATEAELLLADKRPPASEPDLHLRVEGSSIDAADLQRAILARAHRDPFTDGYIRWQLTSLVTDWPVLDHAALIQGLREAPPLLVNPRADEQTMELFRRAAEAGPLRTEHLDMLRAASHALDERTELYEAFNGPALRWRDWLRERLPVDGPQPIFALIEQCGGTIDAGWTTRTVKRRLTLACRAAADRGTLTPQDRSFIAEWLSHLAGRERRFINQITFLADDSVRVTYSIAGVTRRDAERWLERIESGPP